MTKTYNTPKRSHIVKTRLDDGTRSLSGKLLDHMTKDN